MDERGPCIETLLAGRVEIPERTPDGHGQVWLLRMRRLHRVIRHRRRRAAYLRARRHD